MPAPSPPPPPAERAGPHPSPPARRFLVTGATGFIGRRLVSALVARHGADAVTAMVHPRRSAREEPSFQALQALGVCLLECDLLELPRLGLDRPMFAVVYHLAAFAETEKPGQECLVNSQGTRRLLEWLGPALPGRRFIYTSTLAVIDPPPARQLVTEAIQPAPRTDYGRTKFLGEEAVHALQGPLGFDYTILRLCTIIGHGYRPGGMFGRCPELLAANKLAVRVNWPGRVAFLAISDLIRILLALPEVPATANETFVVSNGENPTFDELLDQMAQVLALPRRRVVLPGWMWWMLVAVAWPLAGAPWTPHALRTFCWRVTHITRDGLSADASKLNQVLGYSYLSVQDALRETYRNQKPQALARH